MKARRSILLCICTMTAAIAGAARHESVTGGKFSDPDIWTKGGVPVADEDGCQLVLRPNVNGAVFLNDLGFTIFTGGVRLGASDDAIELVSDLTLAGGYIVLGPSATTYPISIGGNGETALTASIYTSLGAGAGGTYGTQVMTGSGARTYFYGALDHALTSDGVSTNFFYFYSAGNSTNVLAGTYCKPENVSWTKGPWIRSSTMVVTGTMSVPGMSLQDATLAVARGGRLLPLSDSTSSATGDSAIDVCGGIFDHDRDNSDFRFEGVGDTVLTIRDGGIVRSNSKIRFGYGTGVTTVNVSTGGVWTTSQSHYQGGAYRGAIHYEINGGIANLIGKLYLGYEARNTSTGTTYLRLSAGQLRCNGITHEYSWQTAGRAKDVFIYADGGELFALDSNSTRGNSMPNFLGGDISHIRTVIRKGGFLFNTHRSDVTYAGAIEGSDIENEQDGGLIKRGGSKLTLTGGCSYTGANTVEDGTLVLAAVNTATNTLVSSVATLQIAGPSCYSGEVTLDTGAVLALEGSGAYSFAGLSVSRDGVIRLDPSEMSIKVGSDVVCSGNILFDLKSSDNGVYTVLTAGNAGEIVGRCRVLVAAAGKQYTFSADGDALKLTIADKTCSTWTKTDDGVWSENGYWSSGVPGGEGVHAKLAGKTTSRPDIVADTSLTLGALYYASESMDTSKDRGWSVKQSADETLTLTPTDASMPLVHVDAKYNGLYLPVAAGDTIVLSILNLADTRLYSETSFTSTDPNANFLHVNPGKHFVSSSISLPTYFLPGSGVMYANKACAGTFGNGVSYSSGSGIALNDNTVVSGPFRMSEKASISYLVANKKLTLQEPVGYLGALLGAGNHGTLAVGDFSKVTHYIGNTGTTVYQGAQDIEMPLMTLATAYSYLSRHIVLKRAANAGDVAIDGRKLIWDTSATNRVSLLGDATGAFVLDGTFTYPYRNAGARIDLGSGNYTLGNDFVFQSLVDGEGEIVFGSEGADTLVTFQGDAFVEVGKATMLGCSTVDVTGGGTLAAGECSFAGTLRPRVATSQFDPIAIRVGTARFAAGGSIDFGRDAANPLPKKGRIAFLKFDTLSDEDEANLKTWTIAGCGYVMRETAIAVDREAGEVCLTSSSTAGFKLIVR